MLSTMQDVPLTVTRILRPRDDRCTERHRSPPGPAGRAAAPQLRARSAHRAAQLAHALRDELGVAARRTGRHVHVEQRRARRGLFRDPLHGRGAAHPQPPAAPRAADLDRQPRRRPRRHRQRLAAAAARPAAAAVCRPSSTSSSPVPATAVRPRRRPRARARVRGADRRPADHVRLARAGRAVQAAAMCYTSGTTGDPKGVVYSPPFDLSALHAGQHGRVDGADRPGHDRWWSCRSSMCNAWGLPHATFMTGVEHADARPLPPARAARRDDRARAPTHAAAVPTIWQGLLAEVDRPTARRLPPCTASPSAVRPVRPR